MGEEADDIMVGFGLSTEEAKQYNVEKGKFKANFVVKRNVIFERAKGIQRSHHDGESVDNFITDLNYLAEYGQFGTLRDDLIRDRIVDKFEPPAPASVDRLSKGKGNDSKEDMNRRRKRIQPSHPNLRMGRLLKHSVQAQTELRSLDTHVISFSGIEADPEKLQAIADLPPPPNAQEARTFLGIINQLSKFFEHLADKTKSIRVLLHKGNQWTWGSEQQKAFEQIKADLTQVPVLALYDPNKETKVAADASSYGLGGVVLQLQPDNSWRPVSFISRAMTPTKSRYAQIEKEALAFTWACERYWEYIVG
ncbi:hypothetical protein ACROYT_G000979 [Oculina patagonica]